MEGNANLLSLNFYVLLALSSQLSVFEVVYYEYFFAFSGNGSHAVVSGTYPGCPAFPLLRFYQKSYHGWLNMMTS